MGLCWENEGINLGSGVFGEGSEGLDQYNQRVNHESGRLYTRGKEG